MSYNRQLVLDLMVTAFEGGSNYWLSKPATAVKRDDELNYLSVTVTPDETGVAEFDKEYTITPATFRRGLARLHAAAVANAFPAAAQHYADAISENGDAVTADVVLQMGLFGTVIFG